MAVDPATVKAAAILGTTLLSGFLSSGKGKSFLGGLLGGNKVNALTGYIASLKPGQVLAYNLAPQPIYESIQQDVLSRFYSSQRGGIDACRAIMGYVESNYPVDQIPRSLLPTCRRFVGR